MSARAQRAYISGFCNPSFAPDDPSHARCPLEYNQNPCRCSCHVQPDFVAAVREEHEQLLPPTLPWVIIVTESDRTPEDLRADAPGIVYTAPAPVDLQLWTPTGALVTDAEPETDEWFAARREGITGTDLPKILGFSKYGNALSVWLDKRDELTDEAGEAAFWGHVLEDPVALEWARRNQTQVTRVGVLAHDAQPWMRASLDRLVTGPCPDGDGPCGLEVKTRSAFKSTLFRTEVPDDVLAQTTWGLMVTGLHHMHVAVLLGGQELRSFRVDRDPKIEDYLRDAALPVWESVNNGTPPEAHPDENDVLLDLLNTLYAERAGERDLDVEKVRPHLDAYAEGGQLERDGKAMKAKAKAGLVQLLDDGDAGRVDDVLIFTYKKPDAKDVLPADELRRLKDEKPETYQQLKDDGFISTSNPSPQISIKEKSV